MFQRIPTSLLLLVNIRNFLHHLYTLLDQPFLNGNHRLINGLGWRFPDIANLTTVSDEPLLYLYN